MIQALLLMNLSFLFSTVGMGNMTSTSQTALVLFFCLIVLLAFLFYMYKELNRVSYGEYAIRRIVYKEGGVRDQVRGAALALETRFGIQLWPRSDSEEDGEEMQDVQDVEAGGSNGSDTEGDTELRDEEDEHEDEEESYGRENDGSSLEEEEHVKMLHKPQEEKVEEKQDKAKEEAGGAGLIIDLNNFSGSAIWSEEQEDLDMGVTGTAL